MQRRRFFRVALAASGLSLAASLGTPAGAAEDFPARPIRLIVPYGAGGVTDQVTRALADAGAHHLIVGMHGYRTAAAALEHIDRAAESLFGT